MKLRRLTLKSGAVCAAAILGCAVLSPAVRAGHESDYRYQVVTQDRDGNPVRRFELQHCGNDYDHSSHWYHSHRGGHDHWCPGGPHQHYRSRD